MRKMKVSFYGTKEIVGLATELKKMQKHSHGLTRNYTEKNKKGALSLPKGRPRSAPLSYGCFQSPSANSGTLFYRAADVNPLVVRL